MRHSLNNKAAPVVFIQYLLSLAVVEAMRTEPSYKIGGVHMSLNEFLLVAGWGINLNNSSPTTSINHY
ncbi:hypothetical protein Glove_227g156 [Diversispora epigaea]|uniref:Uncharacterized protein n=1 Tax=Diversispora epigaea TaxID=1348612 RepID=A0A397IGU0_9GLOM|nr:hypothetical protein Glove_227g156 [Diversispora epigaea]